MGRLKRFGRVGGFIAVGTLALTVTMSGLVSAQDMELPANADELSELTGDILIDGSSTVYPVTQAAAEEFATFANDVRISVGISGTGGGFSRFCADETDIQDASRPISTSEQELCDEAGVEYIELPIAYDALTVMVNPANDWAECLTVDELNMIWEPAAEGSITNWNQVRDEFPDRRLSLYGADADSGTFDYFTEAITGEAKSSRGDFQNSSDDNVLVQGIAGDENALGFFGYSYYQENTDKLKAVAIDEGNGCVMPSPESVLDGTYQPLSRPIFIYVKASVADRPEVSAFVDFYLSPSFTPIIASPEVGYVPLPQEIYDAMVFRFENRVTGTLFPEGAEVGATLDRYIEAMTQ
ncbi:hypothetical protein BH23CHL5_BH23CHL5_16580 [soil metagenome]